MKKKLIALIAALIVIVIILAIIIGNLKSTQDLIEITSEDELYELAYSEGNADTSTVFKVLFAGPLFLTGGIFKSFSSSVDPGYNYPSSMLDSSSISINKSYTTADANSSSDYSTTNLQVENVDEADIVKTDGEYIYSISNDTVYISYAKDPTGMSLIAKIQEPLSNIYPEDLILQNNKLIVISGNNTKTVVKVYDLANKAYPSKVKEFELNKEYYTSRYTNGILYVISSGRVVKENNLNYSEDGQDIEPTETNAYKINGVNSRYQTIIASYNLNENNSKIKVQSYLMDISNAYISENNMYLLDERYSGSKKIDISSIFGLKGLLGIKDIYDDGDYYFGSTIYKFNFEQNGSVQYQTKCRVEGKTIDQFSLDEKDGNLRVAVYNSSKGSKVVVFDKDLKQIGETTYMAEGEKMYSARFMGDRAYLVTYKNTDPLFSIDLSDPTEPKVLGALKIPGYSTYLQPYDENHIIGFGFQTKENVRRNSLGRVTSTSSTIIGMKMALFDVSDIMNPKTISEIEIGDSRTNSTVLENHKSLLFDKDKNLLAIPIKNYTTDMSTTGSDNLSTLTSSYKSTLRNRKYNKIGYAVYNLDLTNGFKFKGLITHDIDTQKVKSTSYISDIRGLYIDNTLYTVSEIEIKANNLDTLEQINELKFE